MEINLAAPKKEPKPVFISANLSYEINEQLFRLLREGVSLCTYHRSQEWIHVSQAQYQRWMQTSKVSPEALQTKIRVEIKEEIQKLLDVGFIKPIQNPTWLANIVQVKKKSVQIRCCIGFCDLNKAYPKDEFSLPNTDMLFVGPTWRVANLKTVQVQLEESPT